MKKYLKSTLLAFVLVAIIIGAFIVNRSNKPMPKAGQGVNFAKPPQQTQVNPAQENKNKLIMREFDKTWNELEKAKASELKGLSQDKINFKLTPLVMTKVMEKLGVTKNEVRMALNEAG